MCGKRAFLMSQRDDRNCTLFFNDDEFFSPYFFAIFALKKKKISSWPTYGTE